MIRPGPGEGLNSPSSGTSRTSSTASSHRTRCTASRAFSTRAGASRRSACSRASRSRASTMPWRTTAEATSRTAARSRSCGATPRRSWCSARPIRRWRTGCRSSAPTVRAFPGWCGCARSRRSPRASATPRSRTGGSSDASSGTTGPRPRATPGGGRVRASVSLRRLRPRSEARPSPPGANRDPPPAVRVARSPPGAWPQHGTFRLFRFPASRLRRRR